MLRLARASKGLLMTCGRIRSHDGSIQMGDRSWRIFNSTLDSPDS